MSERQSQTNLRRLDGKAEKVTFASKLKLYWAPLGTVAAILGVSLGAFLSAAKPFAAKADAKVVEKSFARDEAKMATDHDRIVKIETEVDDLKDTTAWTRDVVGELAAAQGLKPSPTPTPHPVPSPVDAKGTP